jgi:virginiamycin B lyase
MKRILWFASAMSLFVSGCAHAASVVPTAGAGPVATASRSFTVRPDAGVVAKNFVAAYLNQDVFYQGTGGPIVTGPDGNLYVLGAALPSLLQISPDGVQTKAYQQDFISNYRSLDSGINNQIWFGGGSVLDVYATTGFVKFVTLPDSGTVTAVKKGADGNEWFAQVSPPSVGFVTPGGKVTEYALTSGESPVGLAVGGDKNMWFIDNATMSFARVTPAGVVTEFPISVSCSAGVNYVDAAIVKDNAGNLWASGSCGSGLDFFESSTSGGISVFGAAIDANRLVLGPDGQIWGTNSANQPPVLLRFDKTDDTETTVVLPNKVIGVGGITLGPDGDLWMTTYNATTGDGYINVYDETLYSVGVRLTGEHSYDDPNYGVELGYAIGNTMQTQTISVNAGESVLFHNYDTIPHTASFLGDATMNKAPWPKTFSGGMTASPAGTAIGTTGFSTGTIAAGKNSAYYRSGIPGFYMIGDGYDYNADKMRTVIVVH